MKVKDGSKNIIFFYKPCTPLKTRIYQKICFFEGQNNYRFEVFGMDIEYIICRSYIDCR
jgi:hypothetical protein